MMHWLFRMSKWARNPPSTKRVKFVMAVIALCIAIFLIERYVGWPDWLTADRAIRRGYRP